MKKTDRHLYYQFYYKKNKEKISIRGKRYYKKNKKIISDKHKKYNKKYYQDNKELLKAKSKKWYYLNKEESKQQTYNYRNTSSKYKKYIKKYRKKNHKSMIKKLRQWRHKKKISKKYISKYGGKIFTQKEHHQKRRALEKGGGPLTIQTIQEIYESNIKKYGTLTCYLCLEPIEFKKDCLEHKTPLSRGGTNIRNNLNVSCQKCNDSKGNKTVKEYKQYLKNKRR